LTKHDTDPFHCTWHIVITVGLGTNGKLAITALGSATDVIIDCQGFIM
jgi:hypothetical protein